MTIESITQHLGVAKWGKQWLVIDKETQAQIGEAFKTKQAACAYALYRQDTTYS